MILFGKEGRKESGFKTFLGVLGLQYSKYCANSRIFSLE